MGSLRIAALEGRGGRWDTAARMRRPGAGDVSYHVLMGFPGWFQGAHRRALCGVLLALAVIAGCASGPSPGQINNGLRTAAALNAQAWAQYHAVLRAANGVRVDRGLHSLGVPTGELFPCPSPVTAPIKAASPGDYPPREEYVIPFFLRGGESSPDGQPTQLQAAISDLELGLRHEGFGRFTLDRYDGFYHLAWRGSGMVRLTTTSDGPDTQPTGLYLLIVSRCAEFDAPALPDVITSMRK